MKARSRGLVASPVPRSAGAKRPTSRHQSEWCNSRPRPLCNLAMDPGFCPDLRTCRRNSCLRLLLSEYDVPNPRRRDTQRNDTSIAFWRKSPRQEAGLSSAIMAENLRGQAGGGVNLPEAAILEPSRWRDDRRPWAEHVVAQVACAQGGFRTFAASANAPRTHLQSVPEADSCFAGLNTVSRPGTLTSASGYSTTRGSSVFKYHWLVGPITRL